MQTNRQRSRLPTLTGLSHLDGQPGWLWVKFLASLHATPSPPFCQILLRSHDAATSGEDLGVLRKNQVQWSFHPRPPVAGCRGIKVTHASHFHFLVACVIAVLPTPYCNTFPTVISIYCICLYHSCRIVWHMTWPIRCKAAP